MQVEDHVRVLPAVAAAALGADPQHDVAGAPWAVGGGHRRRAAHGGEPLDDHRGQRGRPGDDDTGVTGHDRRDRAEHFTPPPLAVHRHPSPRGCGPNAAQWTTGADRGTPAGRVKTVATRLTPRTTWPQLIG